MSDMFKVYRDDDTYFSISEDANVMATGDMEIQGVVTASGVFGGTVETYSADGEIAVTDILAEFDASEGALAMSIPDGVEGQVLYLKAIDATNNIVVTPDNFGDGSTLTFDAANEIAVLIFDGTNWQAFTNTATLA